MCYLRIILGLISLFYFSACAPNNCSTLDGENLSADEMVFAIEGRDFDYSDFGDTSKSSWIRAAKYYSCDGEFGYFMLETDDKVYLHKDVPLRMWHGFKRSNSFGRFYNDQLKGRYEY